jgi:hypothetical protein
MSGKRPSLAESMRAVAETPAKMPEPQPRPATQTVRNAEASPPAAQLEDRPKGFYAATREGKKKATVTLSPEAHRQLKLLSVDHGGVEALLTEAINDVFRKYGKEPLA